MDYKRSQHQVFLINYNLIWCPKRRKKVLVGRIAERLKELIKKIAEELKIEILALEVMPDHLHLFVSSYPQLSLPHLVKAIKGRTSHDLREEFPELQRLPSLWTHSYFVSTAGNISEDSIKNILRSKAEVERISRF